MRLDPAVDIWHYTKKSLYPLYERRAAGLEPEMDCHAQAAEIYAEHFQSSHRILDAGGGSGCFFWSLQKRGLLGRYYLLDQNRDFVEMGRKSLAGQEGAAGFLHKSLEETPGEYEAVFCLNTLFSLPDWRQGLERLLAATGRFIIIRTTLGAENIMRYETDDYLDEGGAGLKSYFNIWRIDEFKSFMEDNGFEVSVPVDRRSGDEPEISAGKIFPWRWLVGLRPGA